MSDDFASWLRGEIESDLGRARHILDVRGAWPEPRREMHDAIADCEAKLAILDLYADCPYGHGVRTFIGATLPA